MLYKTEGVEISVTKFHGEAGQRRINDSRKVSLDLDPRHAEMYIRLVMRLGAECLMPIAHPPTRVVHA